MPVWLAGSFAALMIIIAAYCGGRLAIGRLRRRNTEVDADALHVLMGLAMAGMFEPMLSPVPSTVWQVAFLAAAAWFASRSLLARNRASHHTWRCAHPAPHAIECAAMFYMLLPTNSPPDGRSAGLAMPGMNGTLTLAANPVIALVLMIFMLGYIVWTTDRLVALSRGKHSLSPPRWAAEREPRRRPVAADDGMIVRRTMTATQTNSPGWPQLAPRLAASYKIVMSMAMGFMLITML